MHTSTKMQAIKNYIASNKARFLGELIDFLRIPSVSTAQKFSEDVRKAAKFVKQKLLIAGVDKVMLIDTEGYPLVYGEKIIDKNLPTVLVYGHYDVQPADPYELWDTPPFEPAIRDGKIYARGASDDKGQVYIHIKAFETMLATKQLPCNVKFLIEGEEEKGSESITLFLKNKENHARIKADTVLVSDTSLLSLAQPSLDVGLRGIVYLEVEVTGANKDLHSGTYGGAVANPLNVLCKMIASLKDENNRITIPGFYDKVVALSEEERAELNKIPFDLATYKKELGIEDIEGEKGYTTIERTGTRPSLDVNGMWGGYVEEGVKTILPAKAHAKISMRLAPHQEAKEIKKLFISYFTSIAPKSVKVNVKAYAGEGNPFLVNATSVSFQAASKAFEEVWGKRPIPVRCGGTIPIIVTFKEMLGFDIAMMGFGLESDVVHSPNENFSVHNFFKGIETVIAFYEHFVRLHK